MFLCHILDDFVLQPICLSKLKQKSTWKDYPKMYENDYKMALFMHSLSWSIFINLPLFLIMSSTFILVSVILNGTVHYLIDDIKANKGKINLIEDQTIHIIQIITTWLVALYLA